jgi:subtilisin family serine protease
VHCSPSAHTRPRVSPNPLVPELSLRALHLAAISVVASLSLLAAGCASTSATTGFVPAGEGNRYADPEQLVVVTVDNPLTQAAPRPGSTPRGYVGSAGYVASDTARRAIRDIEKQYSLKVVTAWPIAALGVHCAVLRIPAGSSRDSVLAQLGKDARIRLAEPMNNFASRAGGYNDPYAGLQRGFMSIGAEGAQQWSRGEHVRVAVIDTGIDSGHPDFGGRVVVRENFVDRDAAQFDRDRHGTAVAGVISASANNKLGIVGIAPAVELMAFKACWQLSPDSDAARCNSLTLAQALVAAMDHQAQIVNLSLTGPPDALLNSLIAAGAARGILFVGAAPDDADPTGFPAGAPAVIRVDSVEQGGTRNDVLRAPGRNIVTLVPGGRYDFVSGSSLATAHVTGAIALLVAKSKRLDRPMAWRLLRQSEEQRPEAASSINVCAALAELLNQARCAVQGLTPPDATQLTRAPTGP